jgi:FKBP-type peptidyl-prolyl cis-trans isomerase
MTTVLVRSRRLATILGLVTTTLGVAGCSLDGNATLPPFSDPATQTYDASTGVVIANMTRVSQHLYTQDLVEGTGRTVTTGDSISVFYSGRLASGFRFDALSSPSPPFATVISDSTPLIRGWIGGLPGAKVGGTRRLVIGPALGYQYSPQRDQNNRVVIPSNSVLVFDVEIVSANPR